MPIQTTEAAIFNIMFNIRLIFLSGITIELTGSEGRLALAVGYSDRLADTIYNQSKSLQNQLASLYLLDQLARQDY